MKIAGTLKEANRLLQRSKNNKQRKENEMTPAKAILTGAILIAASVILTQTLQTAKAQTRGEGPYILMRHSNASATSSVFRLDTNSGGVSFCFVNASGTSISCTREAM